MAEKGFDKKIFPLGTDLKTNFAVSTAIINLESCSPKRMTFRYSILTV
jgi:hypothetical protein